MYRQLPLMAFCLTGAIVVCPAMSADEAAPRKFPDLPKASTSFGAARLGDSLFVYGGHHGRAHHYSTDGQSSQLLRLNLDKPAKWEVVSQGPKLQGLALVAYRGKLYRVGGFTARNKPDDEHDLWSSADFASFDPKTKNWQHLSPMPVPRSSFDAAIVADTLYVVGGWSMQGGKDNEWHDSAYSIDLSNGKATWTELPQPPFKRRALSVAAHRGQLYAIGGMQSDNKITTKTAIFDPQADKWTEGPILPGKGMEGFGSAAFPLGDHLYVSTSSGKLLRLSGDAASWEVVAELQSARFFHRMLPVSNHSFALFGGANMQQGRFSNVEVTDVNVQP